MGEVGVAGRPFLLAMRLHGVDVGAIEQRLAGGRVVAFDALDQVVLPHHLRLAGILRFYCLLNDLRDDIEAALKRRPSAGLVLHARQVGRGARHRDPWDRGGASPVWPSGPHGPRCRLQDITTLVNRYTARPLRLCGTALPKKTNGPGKAGPWAFPKKQAIGELIPLPRAALRAA